MANATKKKAPGKKPAIKKSKALARKGATKPAAKKSAAKKPAASKTSAAKKPAAKREPVEKYGARADKGAPIDGYLARLAGDQRAIADQLVSIIASALPGASAELKWGMPVWSVGGQMLAYFRAQKHDVRFGLAYVTGLALPDPEGRLEGTGSDGKHVKLTSPAQIDPARFAEWLKTAAAARA